MPYTKKEEEFLIENYPIYGAKYCSIKINKSPDAIGNKARRLGLKAGNNKHPSLQKISVNQFLSITSKEVAYFLGYFWADGYIHHYMVKNCNHWRIALEIQAEDAKEIEPILNRLGAWVIVKRKRKSNWKETWTYFTANKDLYNFLLDSGYDTKSSIDPVLILEKIPIELHPYFWKGFFDGDSHISIKQYKNTIHCVFEIAGEYNYKWTSFLKALEKISITKFNIYNYIHKTKDHKSSHIKIYGKEILKLKPLFVDFGLKRKNLSFTLIESRYQNDSFA